MKRKSKRRELALATAVTLAAPGCTSNHQSLDGHVPYRGGEPAGGLDPNGIVSDTGSSSPGEGGGVVTPDAPPPQAPAPSQAEVERLVAADFAKLDARSQSDVRYLSIAHLGKLPARDLETARFGITKTLNSLSYAPQIKKPEPVDAARTVLRMRLSDYQWTAETWRRIEGAEHGKANVQRVGGATLAKGDWLVFAATRPEVYDPIVGVPVLEGALDAKLGVDRSQAVYLGVRESIVTFNGRILERVPIETRGKPGGYYWRSWDFVFEGALENALQTGDTSFIQSRGVADLIAGEFIWSLPNGMQAYMLSGFGAQHRYDAQSFVARDPRRKDKLVINGESCITCHANGLNVRRNEMQGGDDNAALFAQDNARFAAALREMGHGSVDAEPIGATIDLFKADRGVEDFREQRGETDAVFGL